MGLDRKLTEPREPHTRMCFAYLVKFTDQLTASKFWTWEF